MGGRDFRRFSSSQMLYIFPAPNYAAAAVAFQSFHWDWTAKPFARVSVLRACTFARANRSRRTKRPMTKLLDSLDSERCARHWQAHTAHEKRQWARERNLFLLFAVLETRWKCVLHFYFLPWQRDDNICASLLLAIWDIEIIRKLGEKVMLSEWRSGSVVASVSPSVWLLTTHLKSTASIKLFFC